MCLREPRTKNNNAQTRVSQKCTPEAKKTKQGIEGKKPKKPATWHQTNTNTIVKIKDLKGQFYKRKTLVQVVFCWGRHVIWSGPLPVCKCSSVSLGRVVVTSTWGLLHQVGMCHVQHYSFGEIIFGFCGIRWGYGGDYRALLAGDFFNL